MNTIKLLDTKILSQVSDFLTRNEIRSIAVNKGVGITKSIEISDIDIMFIKDHENQSLDYSVKFKLQKECADIFKYIKSIQTLPDFDIELVAGADKTGGESLSTKLETFIRLITARVRSAQKEQKVQNISYVGNTFILNNSTRFKVLSDDGEGRLNIEVLTRDLPLDALLTASGLLDGLYLGAIKLVES